MSAPSLLVIGRTGQLARSLDERSAAAGLKAVFVGRPDLNLLDPLSIRKVFREAGARVVINAAAYTAVDRAEEEPELALALNTEAPRLLAEAAREAGARFVHVSTDYVFDGRHDAPYDEDSPTAPLGVYGRTKLAGEAAVREAGPDHLILRTAWVYSPFGRNFVRTMIDLARSRPELRVVGDQRGSPTSALDLADGILAAVAKWSERPQEGLGRTFNLAGTQEASWAELASEALRCSRSLGGPYAEVVPITTEEWPTPVERPRNSRLDSSRFAAAFGYRAPPLRDSVGTVVKRLLEEQVIG